MRRQFSWVLVLSLFMLVSCSKDKAKNSRYYQYKINPSYTGAHPKTDFETNVYVLDNEGVSLQFQVETKGTLLTKEYAVYIYQYDTTQSFGYSATPVYNLGKITNTNGLFAESSIYNFNAFAQDFKGYIVINDPDNIQRDTTSLLLFGKIGSEW